MEHWAAEPDPEESMRKVLCTNSDGNRSSRKRPIVCLMLRQAALPSNAQAQANSEDYDVPELMNRSAFQPTCVDLVAVLTI